MTTPKTPTPPPAEAPRRLRTKLTELQVMSRVERMLGELDRKAASRVLAWLCLKAADQDGGTLTLALKPSAAPDPEAKS